MLGRLARWIRFMGYHVLYATSAMTDDDIAERCNSGSLILLTRDRELCERVGRSVWIESVKLDRQIDQFLSLYRPDSDAVMLICPVCDGNLSEVARETVNGKVPVNVYRLNSRFWKCGNCGKIYWKGSHYDRIMKKIAEHTGEN